MNDNPLTEAIRVMNEKDLKRLLALKDVSGLGSKRTIDLLEKFSSLDRVFEAEYHEFSEVSYMNEDIFGRLQEASHRLDEYQNVVMECRNADIDFMSVLDNNFPKELKDEGIVALLFTKGNLNLFRKPCVSIVGSRDSSENSVNWAFNVAKNLSQEGYIIVSGGARGIDTAAHKGALAGSGETICVLGSGISNVYPPENEALIEEISKTGLVISHRSPSQEVNRYSLLDRNEITSGLSLCLLIVASSGQGGTASQYQDALAQNKQILCPDPSIGLEPSAGIVDILEEGHAEAVYDVDDILDLMESHHRQTSLEEL